MEPCGLRRTFSPHTTCLILHRPLCCDGLRAACTGLRAAVPGYKTPWRGAECGWHGPGHPKRFCQGAQLWNLPLLLQPKSLPSPQIALGTSWMEVSEDTCLVWGLIPRAWHNVWPEATLVNEETGPVALPRLPWMIPTQSSCRTSISLFPRRVILPQEKVQTA